MVIVWFAQQVTFFAMYPPSNALAQMPRLCLLLPLGWLRPPGMRTELSKEQRSGGWGHQGDTRDVPTWETQSRDCLWSCVGPRCLPFLGCPECQTGTPCRWETDFSSPWCAGRSPSQERSSKAPFWIPPIMWKTLRFSFAPFPHCRKLFLHMTPNLAEAVFFFFLKSVNE